MFSRYTSWSILIGLVLLGIWFGTVSHDFEEYLMELTQNHRVLAALVLACIMCASTVFAPITTMPIIPVVAPILGPFTTGLAAFCGWTVGAIIAFLIARYAGRPILARFINLDHIKKFEERFPQGVEFTVIVALRMLMPVDILSYILGIVSTVSFIGYTLATMLGIVWFSFMFAYMGAALQSHDYVLLSSIGVGSVIVLGVAWNYIRRFRTSQGTKTDS